MCYSLWNLSNQSNQTFLFYYEKFISKNAMVQTKLKMFVILNTSSVQIIRLQYRFLLAHKIMCQSL